ncbi:unnamed protein product [Brassicogethes aeneus]|uniref:Uncharacterized protein n=1 Tax=Brassicogethes aeneus TaxID=1431903 RepID=A0A9P0AZ05_BRAAE|nr:unnamed protein product [Brassicogethes aeneus]
MPSKNREFTVILVLCFAYLTKTEKPCASFNNIKVSVVQLKGEPFEATIYGCVQRPNFRDEVIVSEILVSEQNVPRLGRDAIRHMPRLTSLVFENCGINNIMPGSMRNLPKLRYFEVNKSGLARILYGTFQELFTLETIKIHNTDLNEIDTDAFGFLPNLKETDLSNNQLNYFDRTWFTNSTNLEILNLQHNKIRTIERKSFKPYHRLREIQLDHNDITLLETNSFKGLRHLEHLSLTYNKLKSIDSDIFPNSIKITRLNIAANHLTYLPTQLMDKLIVRKVMLDGNPWECQCLHKVTNWLYSSGANLEKPSNCGDIPVCYSSTVNEKSCMEVDDDEVRVKYFEALRRLGDKVHKHCARLN